MSPGPGKAVVHTTCPHCGQMNTLTAGVGLPSAGDVSICWGCAGVAVFDIGPDGQRSVRLATPLELLAINLQHDIPAIVAAVESQQQTPLQVARHHAQGQL